MASYLVSGKRLSCMLPTESVHGEHAWKICICIGDISGL